MEINRKITFSPPQVLQEDIDAVVEVLKSGWITTGPKTKQFEEEIAKYCSVKKAVTFNSATAAMELALRFLGVKEGDEVITSAYTYTASASVICHVGATPVLVDVYKDTTDMNLEELESKITSRTKAIIPVDIAGKIVPYYDKLFEIVERKRNIFKPESDIQKKMGRIAILADGAHSFGAVRSDGKKAGSIADMTAFSFHAVKNLTTAEGGALTFDFDESDEYYNQFMHLSLHGQTKDALSKLKAGAWKYDIVAPYYKCNMTDINSALGLSQLNRYSEILKNRRDICHTYSDILKEDLFIKPDITETSYHLYLLRLKGFSEEMRNEVIERLAQRDISANVHYQPLPMLSAYKNLGFDIKDYPNSYDYYRNEITLPLNNIMDVDDAKYVALHLRDILKEMGHLD